MEESVTKGGVRKTAIKRLVVRCHPQASSNFFPICISFNMVGYTHSLLMITNPIFKTFSQTFKTHVGQDFNKTFCLGVTS